MELRNADRCRDIRVVERYREVGGGWGVRWEWRLGEGGERLQIMAYRRRFSLGRLKKYAEAEGE